MSYYQLSIITTSPPEQGLGYKSLPWTQHNR